MMATQAPRPGRGSFVGFVPLLTLLLSTPVIAVPVGTAPPLALRDRTPGLVAFTDARLVIAPGRTVEKGTLVIKDGMIVAAGAGVKIPAGATVRSLAWATIYPGFLDASVPVGFPSSATTGLIRDGADGPSGGPGSGGPSGIAGPGASSWNPHVTPGRRVELDLPADSLAAKLRSTLRSQGVTVALVAPARGVVRGQGALLTTADGPLGRLVVKPQASMHLALNSGLSFDDQGYPQSPMGAVALLRQTFADAAWYTRAQAACARDPKLPRPETEEGLAALTAFRTTRAPFVIDAQDELYVLRADRLARELGFDAIVRGSGREYRQLDAIRATGRTIIVPLSFPKAPIVDTPEQAMNVSLEDLMHWDVAPENAGRLAKAGVPIALTSDRLEDRGTFLVQVRKAVDRGLTPAQALAALTTTPARALGVGDRLGTLEAGKQAHFVITDGDLFAATTKVREVWIDGEAYPIKPWPELDLRGRWLVTLDPPAAGADSIVLALAGQPDSLGGTLRLGKDTMLKSAQLLERQLFVSLSGDSLGKQGVVRLSGAVEGAGAEPIVRGTGVWPDGAPFAWSARRIAAYTPPADTAAKPPPVRASYEPNFPLGDCGRNGIPERPAVVAFEGATVWTSGPAGRIEGATVLVENGVIRAVGKDVRVPASAVRIDARGKHITPGLIDAHSHTATDGGINEGGQNVTAEVRIGDFIDPNDIALYRELAGGLTAAHILHGSANAIGGQSQMIKLRWGAPDSALKFAGWPATIKFALGENPKQSNWGLQDPTRYPQSRMGVEQLIRDRFAAARDYTAEQKRGTMANGLPARRDYELETIAQILDGTRTIHSHAYRQDEILMLMRVAEEYGIRVGTFQHILEGYKVADVMAAHGAGGSTFSDWWAYKMEVIDAIPFNGALMHRAGVLVSFNSDSDELARRLNTEAGKAVKYGGVSPEEALEFVTANPAKQLKVDAKVGSLEPGKDADLVVWSGPPLSPLSLCEQTWIDGRRYFDRAEDLAMRVEQERMKQVLAQKALAAPGGSGGGGPGGRGVPRHDWADEHDEGDDGGFGSRAAAARSCEGGAR